MGMVVATATVVATDESGVGMVVATATVGVGGAGMVTTARVVGGTITVTLLVVKVVAEGAIGRRVVTGGIRRFLNVRVMVLM